MNDKAVYRRVSTPLYIYSEGKSRGKSAGVGGRKEESEVRTQKLRSLKTDGGLRPVATPPQPAVAAVEPALKQEGTAGSSYTKPPLIERRYGTTCWVLIAES